MAQEEFRLLSAALMLSRFSAADLVRTASVKRNTAGSWLRRNQRLLEQVPSGCSHPADQPIKRGRPRLEWRLRDDVISDVRDTLNGLRADRDRSGPEPAALPGASHILDRVEKQFDAWKAVVAAGHNEAAKGEHATLRTWLRMTWEDFADVFAAGFEVPTRHLTRLAELERDAGAGALADDWVLPEITVWLTCRLGSMIDRGVHPAFAGQTLRIRTEVRPQIQRVKVSAAAAGAKVWADEGLAERHGMPVDAILRCHLFTDASPVTQQAAEVAIAIEHGPWSFCSSERETEAVLLGLVAQRTERSESERSELALFLRGLHTHDCWAPELARASYYGLRHTGGLNIVAWLGSLNLVSREALKAEPDSHWADVGAVRREAWIESRKFYERYGNVRMSGDNNHDRLGQLTKTFAVRAARSVS